MRPFYYGENTVISFENLSFNSVCTRNSAARGAG